MSETEHEQDTTEAAESAADADALADDEQDAAESEEAEEAAHEPGEPAEPEAATQEVWEARHAAADAKFATYVRAMSKIYEDDAPKYLQCPLCADSPAGFLNPAAKGRVPPEVAEVVLAFLGLTGAENVQKDPFSRECDTCGGWGRCATGSRVPNMETLPCLPCGGLGWLPTGPERSRDTPPAARDNGATEGTFVPAAVGPESPEVAQLRQLGYTVIPPMQGVS